MKAKICKRIQKINGKTVESNDYYLRYTENGKQVWKRLKGITNKREAEEYLRNEFLPMYQKYEAVETAEELEIQARKRVVKTQGLDVMKLDDVFGYVMSKPRSRKQTERRLKQKARIYKDFVGFVKTEFGIETVNELNKLHAESYINYIRENGKYLSGVEYQKKDGKTYTYAQSDKLATYTLNYFLMVLKEIFNILKGDVFVLQNPFEHIQKLKEVDETSRYDFTGEEIEKIFEYLENDLSVCKFCKPLFVTALHTGFREGDICTLKWENVNFEGKYISKILNKTKVRVAIPFLGNFEDYLKEQLKNKDESGFVFPELAEKYRVNQTYISRSIKTVLVDAGIDNVTVEVEGRSRKTSKKDLHSCRHTFATLAMRNGVNPEIVKQILGHTDIKMTEHYTHLNLEDARKELQKIENLFGKKVETDLDKIRKALESADEKTIEKIKKLLDIL